MDLNNNGTGDQKEKPTTAMLKLQQRQQPSAWKLIRKN